MCSTRRFLCGYWDFYWTTLDGNGNLNGRTLVVTYIYDQRDRALIRIWAILIHLLSCLDVAMFTMFLACSSKEAWDHVPSKPQIMHPKEAIHLPLNFVMPNR